MLEGILLILIVITLIICICSKEDEQEIVVCTNCGFRVTEDYVVLTEHDGFICEQCLKDGYGK